MWGRLKRVLWRRECFRCRPVQKHMSSYHCLHSMLLNLWIQVTCLDVGEGRRAAGTWPAEGKRSRSTHFHPQGEIWGCEDAPRRWNPFSWVKLAPVLRWSGGQQHQKPPQGRESHSHTIKHLYYPCFIRSLVGKTLQYVESMCWETTHPQLGPFVSWYESLINRFSPETYTLLVAVVHNTHIFEYNYYSVFHIHNWAVFPPVALANSSMSCLKAIYNRLFYCVF